VQSKRLAAIENYLHLTHMAAPAGDVSSLRRLPPEVVNYERIASAVADLPGEECCRFPHNDVVVESSKRTYLTVTNTVPSDISHVPRHIQDCFDAFTHKWTSVRRKTTFQAAEPKPVPRYRFESDYKKAASSDADQLAEATPDELRYDLLQPEACEVRDFRPPDVCKPIIPRPPCLFPYLPPVPTKVARNDFFCLYVLLYSRPTTVPLVFPSL